MRERFSPKQIKIAESFSRRFEKSWRVVTYPGRYSQTEAEKSMNFFEKEGKKLAQSLHPDSDPEVARLLNSVFLGLFHRNISIPLEFSPKPPNIN